MLDPLEFKGVSYVLIQLLAFIALILSVVSLRKELISEKPAHGFFSFILVIAGFCVLISLFAAYIQFRGERGIARVREVNVGPGNFLNNASSDLGL